MSHKQFLSQAAAREKILRGAAALADAVRPTLGPRSKCVLIGKKWGPPVVCNDGVTIAKEVELADPEENLGAQILREAAERTGDNVGDGTTTSTILAHAILADGMRNVAAGASAIDLKRGIDRALVTVVATLKAASRPVKTRTEKAQIATISAHNDAAMGEVVAEAVEKVGPDGAITVEEAKGTTTRLDIVEGMKFDRGWISPYFVTDPRRMECVLTDPLILLTETKVAQIKGLIPVLEEAAKRGRPILVIGEDVEGEALATMVVNKMGGSLHCAAVKAPGYGDNRKLMLGDIAVLTGGRVLSEELGVRLENAVSYLGEAGKVVIGRDTTTIVGGKGDRAGIADRIAEIRAAIEESKSDYDKEKLKERLARLAGGVAVIQVGAPSEAEMKSRKEAFEDAINSTRAAIEEGLLPGAGWSLLKACAALEKEEAAADGDIRTGIRILRHALEAPTRQIAVNSGFDGGVVVEKMRDASGSIGFDASKGTWVDLVEAGIVDPAKVVRVALENAVSVASTLLLTDATLTEIEDEKRTSHASMEMTE